MLDPQWLMEWQALESAENRKLQRFQAKASLWTAITGAATVAVAVIAIIAGAIVSQRSAPPVFNMPTQVVIVTPSP